MLRLCTGASGRVADKLMTHPVPGLPATQVALQLLAVGTEAGTAVQPRTGADRLRRTHHG